MPLCHGATGSVGESLEKDSAFLFQFPSGFSTAMMSTVTKRKLRKKGTDVTDRFPSIIKGNQARNSRRELKEAEAVKEYCLLA